MTEGKEISPVHCEGAACIRHCENLQCTWFTCKGCRKTIIFKLEET